MSTENLLICLISVALKLARLLSTSANGGGGVCPPGGGGNGDSTEDSPNLNLLEVASSEGGLLLVGEVIGAVEADSHENNREYVSPYADG